MSRTTLAIDVGTSKVAAAVVRVEDQSARGVVIDHASIIHHSDLPRLADESEQRVGMLWDATLDALHHIDKEALSHVHTVGFCGQMHGCVVLDRGGQPLTNAITWRDQRTGQAFIDRLAARSGHRLFAGQTMVNLAYLHQRGSLAGAGCAVNIMDYFGMKLSGQTRGFIDPTNAHAWGLLRLPELQWDVDAIQRCGIPQELLPTVVPSGASIGQVSHEMSRITGIPQGAPVCVSCGDHQASVLGCLTDPDRQIAINLGSGGQCTVVAPRNFPIIAAPKQLDYELRPFFDGRFLICTAILAGGIAWRWLAESLRSILNDLGIDSSSQNLSEDAIFQRLNQLGASATEALPVDPRFCGERNDQHARGSIGNIDLTNFRLGPLARGLAEGIVATLKQRLPPEVLADKTSVCLTGNAFRRNPLLCEAAHRVFGLPVLLSPDAEEAAIGAAMLPLRAK